jgi:hypothetical protein
MMFDDQEFAKKQQQRISEIKGGFDINLMAGSYASLLKFDTSD